MKFYESHYEEYIESKDHYNIHPELKNALENTPTKISQMGNMIFYGPSGVGKYTQVLSLLKKYSSIDLKYDKKITIQTDKQTYTYHISDIHYEIDMSLLGCNSKILWHEIFLQIVEIISIKNEKTGFIVCKNFHMIHSELLEIFYSYLQQYSHTYSPIQIYFIIITEHISFLPNNIIQSCKILNICRPTKQQYENMATNNKQKIKMHEQTNNIDTDNNNELNKLFISRISNAFQGNSLFFKNNIKKTLERVDTNGILNGKELRSFNIIKPGQELPKEVFNIVCDNLIQEIINHDKLSFTTFRDSIYDILIYNLDAVECIWYILFFFIQNNYLTKKNTSDILKKTYTFLKYYNNNYRPIYHLESIMFYFIIKVHNYES
jgi:hypothetical protein